MALRTPSLQNDNIVAIDREIGSQYDNVKLVAEHIDDVASVAAIGTSVQDVAEVLPELLLGSSLVQDFNLRYLGAKGIDPTVDNQGNALTQGALYFNTVSNVLKVWGTMWTALPVSTLATLTDVALTSVATSDVLTWNGTKWINTSAPKVGSMQLAGGTTEQGILSWNTDERTADLTLGSNVVLQVGQEQLVGVRNGSGAVINGLVVCMYNGTIGNSGKLTVVPYDSSDSRMIVGIATEAIAVNADGYITTFGKIRGVDTRAWTEGDILYVTTGGALTNVAPSTGLKLPIAVVISSSVNGTVFVRVGGIDENKYALKTGSYADLSILDMGTL